NYWTLHLGSAKHSNILQNNVLTSSPIKGSPESILLLLCNAGPGGGYIRRGRGWREWRRGDPTLINSLWKSRTPL
ncbi:hypothetical protein L9F63_024060, partial [Diploptera punctata]